MSAPTITPIPKFSCFSRGYELVAECDTDDSEGFTEYITDKIESSQKILHLLKRIDNIKKECDQQEKDLKSYEAKLAATKKEIAKVEELRNAIAQLAWKPKRDEVGNPLPTL